MDRSFCEANRRTQRGRFTALDQSEAESACRFIESLAAAALGVPPCELRSKARGCAAAALARHVAMYLAHVCLGLCLSRVGAHFGRDRTTVAYACARIEDGRDNPGADRVLACLEAALYRWRGAGILEEIR